MKFEHALLPVYLLLCAVGILNYGSSVLALGQPIFALGGLLAVLLGFTLVFSRDITFTFVPSIYGVCGFLIYAVALSIFSVVPIDSWVVMHYLAVYAVVYFSIMFVLRRRWHMESFIVVVVAIVVAQTFYGLWQVVNHTDQVIFAEKPAGYIRRASGTYINPNHLGALICIAVGLILGRLTYQRRTFADGPGPFLAVSSVVWFYCLLVCFGGLIMCGSRGAWIAGGVVLVLAIYEFVRSSRLPIGWIWAALGLGAFAVVMTGNISIVQERLAASVKPWGEMGSPLPFQISDVTLGLRSYLWKACLDMSIEHPFGVGPGIWEAYFPQYRPPGFQLIARHAHNDFLQVICEYGWVGISIAMSVLYYALREMVSAARNILEDPVRRAYAIACSLALLGLIGCAMWDYPLGSPSHCILLAGLLGFSTASKSPRGGAVLVVSGIAFRRTVGCLFVILGVGLGISGTRMTAARIQGQIGESLRQADEPDEAVAILTRALQTVPADSEARFELASSYIALSKAADQRNQGDRMKQYNALAVDEFREGLRWNRRSSRGFLGLAEGLARSGESIAAAEAIENAFRLDPQGANILADGGIIFWGIGDRDRAVTALSNSLNAWWNPQVFERLQKMGVTWHPPPPPEPKKKSKRP